MRDRARSTVAESLAGPRRQIGTLIALAVAFLILVSLGTWQVERLQWKEGLIAEIDARRTAAPITADQALADIAKGIDVDYRAIALTGRFDHPRERYFLATSDGTPGFYVYTPLTLADGRIVFVNRGFVPDELKDPAKRKLGEIEGNVTVQGLARAKLTAKPSFMVPDNEPAKNLFFWKDMDAMAASAGIDRTKVLPFFVDAGPAPNPGGYPTGGVTQIDLPNNHLSYAVTWYGLAAALVVIATLATRRRAARSG
jgi:surfeit locus 1 family protein